MRPAVDSQPLHPRALPPMVVRHPDMLLARRNEALSTGDVAAAFSLHRPGAVLVPWHLPAVSGDGLRRMLASLAAYKCAIRLAQSDCVLSGETAELSGTWSLCGDSDGRRVALAARVTASARREDGDGDAPSWRIEYERWQPVG